MKSKRVVPSAVKNHSRKYGIPNHLHSDRAPEFLAGATLDYCLDQAIRVTTTGGKNKAHQNSRAEKKVGVIKGLTWDLQRVKGIHLLYTYLTQQLTGSSLDQFFVNIATSVRH